MTFFSVLMRTIGLSFQVFISNSIGAEGVGLFQLVMSVNSLAITVATSGVRFAVTRLTAEVIGEGRPGDVRKVVRCCFIYAAGFGLLAFVLVFLNSGHLARFWAGDLRTEIPVKIFSLGLVFISLSTVIGGYFTAVGRIGRAALLQLGEQLCMICLTMLFLPHTKGSMENGCSAIATASVAADAIIFIISIAVYWQDVRRYRSAHRKGKYFSRLLSISLPLALSAYARTVLNTLQHMLTPAGLRRSGASAEEALSAYGVVHGMALPLVLFPSALFTSLAELLIPELTTHQISGNADMVNRTVNRTLRLCLAFSICCAAILFTFGGKLGELLYKNAEAGHYARLLSPLVVIMYMDTVTDGMLKGLGQQLYTMGVNIVDAALSLAMVFWLLPIYAVKAYIFIIFFTECFNFILSMLRLTRMADIHINIKDIIRPLLCSLISVNFPLLLLNMSGLENSKIALAAVILISSLLCAILLRGFGQYFRKQHTEYE